MVQDKDKKGVSFEDIARFFLAFANEAGEPITNLKLQKLVYYAQAWYLANYGKPLFVDADFQAWVHGPVIPELYQEYKSFGFGPIVSSIKLEEIEPSFEKETKEFLYEVVKMYMPYGAYELEMMTHKEEPWIEARFGYQPDERCEKVISIDTMKRFYEQAKNKTN